MPQSSVLLPLRAFEIQPPQNRQLPLLLSTENGLSATADFRLRSAMLLMNGWSQRWILLLEMYGWGAECGRWTDRSYGIRWAEWKCGKGAEVWNEVRKKGRCGTYNVGVKDLASAYVLCPRLAECGGLSIYGRNRGLRNNKGIGSGVMTSALRSGPVQFLHLFLQDRDRTGPRSFQNPKKPDRNR